MLICEILKLLVAKSCRSRFFAGNVSKALSEAGGRVDGITNLKIINPDNKDYTKVQPFAVFERKFFGKRTKCTVTIVHRDHYPFNRDDYLEFSFVLEEVDCTTGKCVKTRWLRTIEEFLVSPESWGSNKAWKEFCKRMNVNPKLVHDALKNLEEYDLKPLQNWENTVVLKNQQSDLLQTLASQMK